MPYKFPAAPVSPMPSLIQGSAAFATSPNPREGACCPSPEKNSDDEGAAGVTEPNSVGAVALRTGSKSEGSNTAFVSGIKLNAISPQPPSPSPMIQSPYQVFLGVQ